MGQTPPADNSDHEFDYFRQPRADPARSGILCMHGSVMARCLIKCFGSSVTWLDPCVNCLRSDIR